jgi:DNA-binding NarL/FixJ family response regulator
MGVGPLDSRIGGIRKEGLYLLTGDSDAAKLACQLQFVAHGLENGERAAILSAAPPEDLLAQAEYLGLDIASHWHNGSCLLLGFKGEYAQRIVHAPNPAEAFDELTRMIETPVDRIAVDPGSFLWSTRAGTSMAQTFALWAESSGAITMASVAAGLETRPDPASEWVLQRATGVFHFARSASGVHEVSIQRLTPPVDASSAISLALVAGEGLVAPSGQVERRQSDRGRANRDKALLLRLGVEMPADLEAWLTDDRESVDAKDGMDFIQRLQGDDWGLVCVYVDRRHTAEAIEVIRTARPITSGAILLLSDSELRSGDRAAALDAGADDVLSHGIHLKELDARIRRALDSARRADVDKRAPAASLATVTGLLAQVEFESLVSERAAAEASRNFSLIMVAKDGASEIEDVLLESIRAESGDVVGRIGDGFGVLLQDARSQQAESFMARVEAKLAQQGAKKDLQSEVLAHPEESDRIRTLIEA